MQTVVFVSIGYNTGMGPATRSYNSDTNNETVLEYTSSILDYMNIIPKSPLAVYSTFEHFPRI